MKKIIYILLPVLLSACAHNGMVERAVEGNTRIGVAKYMVPNRLVEGNADGSDIAMNNKNVDETVGIMKKYCGGDYIKTSEKQMIDDCSNFLIEGRCWYTFVSFKCKNPIDEQK